jgi:hypothetical protein
MSKFATEETTIAAGELRGVVIPAKAIKAETVPTGLGPILIV